MEILSDRELLKRYDRDVSGMVGLASGVIRARDKSDVRDAVHEAIRLETTLLPVGGQTSTTGASVSRDNGLILDMRALAFEPMLDGAQNEVVVAPGMGLGALQDWLAVRGLELPVDPTSRHDCTVGGAIATNASGPSTYRHGSMGAWVQSVEWISGQGALEVARRTRVEKQAMGPPALRDEIGFIVGSEGIFGAIVQATIRVVPVPTGRVGGLVGFGDRAALIDGVGRLQGLGPGAGIRAIEWLDEASCAVICAAETSSKFALPAHGPAGCLYVETEGSTHDDALDAMEQAVTTAQPDPARAAHAAIFPDLRAIGAFAVARHAVPDNANRRGKQLASFGGGKVSTDWSVPIHRLEEVLQWTDERLSGLPIESVRAFGHIGNGHPHLNILCPDAQVREHVDALLRDQLKLVASVGGVAVSEHGIGKLKRELVRPFLSAGSVAALKALKRLYDPNGVFAPGNVAKL